MKNRQPTSPRTNPPDLGQSILPPLLTVGQAAVALAMSRTSVIEAIERGELPSIRLNNRRRIPTAKIEQLFKDAESDRRRRRQEAGKSETDSDFR